MKQINTRRIVPASIMAVVAFSILGLVQLFIVAGGFEIPASTVRKIAPFAYEPYRKLVGEHPSTRPDWLDAGGEAKTSGNDSPSAMATVAGFRPEELAVKIEGVEEKPVILEPSVPVEKPVGAEQPVAEPEKRTPVDDDVPVG